MSLFLYMIFGLVSILASMAGAICGIGGGVLIKPVLDAFGVLDVDSISFLSGCTVLAMSLYSIVKAKFGGNSLVNAKTGTPLAVGAALGGLLGKELFQYISGVAADKNQVGAVQAVCLLVITFGTMVYTLKKDHIRTHHVTSGGVCIGIGMVLGIFSSFLGIGGGPINLVVLFYFFSIDTKTAAQNSLYIILFSQTASIFNTLVTKTVPEFETGLFVLMTGMGILGGAIGRVVNRKIDGDTVNRLFICMMLIIMLICVYNMIQFI